MVLRFKFWLKGKLPSKCWQWLVWAKAKCKGRAIYRHASYSIEGEDRILSALMGDKEGKSGFYVDVGAHHPFRYSNTYLFYTWGWRGINIDATPGSMAAFRKHRPRDINIECAIGNVIADNKESQAFSSPLVRGNTAPCSKSCKETPPEILTTFQVCHVLGKARLIEESLLKTPKSTTSDSKSNSSGFQALRHDNRDRVAGDSNRDSSLVSQAQDDKISNISWRDSVYEFTSPIKGSPQGFRRDVEFTSISQDLAAIYRNSEDSMAGGGGGLYPQSFVEYYIFNESAWNTCNKDVAAQSEGILQKIVKVPIYRLCDVFDIYMPKDVEIDFLSVDCEGFDLSVLSSNDWQRYRPKFVVVEILSNVYGELDMFALGKNEIAQFLFSKDYALVAKAHNSVIFKDIALL